MSHKQYEQVAVTDSKKLRERAANCHRLAVGAGDLEFAIKLEAIADEYEARAAQADSKVSPKK